MQCLLALLLTLMLGACHRTQPPPRVPEPSPEPSPAPATVTSPPTAQPDLFLAMPTVLHALNEARAAHGAQPLRIDRGLALVAQQTSARYQRQGAGLDRRTAARLGIGDRVASDAYRELSAFSLTFSDVRALIACLDDLSTVPQAMQPAMDTAWRFAGLAVDQSPGPDAGFAVVLILGQ